MKKQAFFLFLTLCINWQSDLQANTNAENCPACPSCDLTPYNLCWGDAVFTEPPTDLDPANYPWSHTTTDMNGSGVDMTVTVYQAQRNTNSDPDPEQSYVSPGSRCGCDFTDVFGCYLSCGEVFRNWHEVSAPEPDTIIINFSEPIYLPAWGFGGFKTGSSTTNEVAVAGFTFYDGPNMTGNKVVSTLANPGSNATINECDPLTAAINQINHSTHDGLQETVLHDNTYYFEGQDQNRAFTLLDLGCMQVHSIFWTQYTAERGSDPPYTPIDPTNQNNSGYVSSFDFYKCECTATDTYDVSIAKTVNNDLPNINDTITFTLIVTNHEAAVTGTTVTDVLPTNLVYTNNHDASTGTFDGTTWTIGNMAVGTSDTLDIDVKVIAEGVHNNSASVAITETETDLTNNEDDACVSVPIEICDDGSQSVDVTGFDVNGDGSTMYRWYVSADNGATYDSIPANNGGTAQTYNITQAGYYTYVVNDGDLGNCGEQLCCPIIVETTTCVVCPPKNCIPIQIEQTN